VLAPTKRFAANRRDRIAFTDGICRTESFSDADVGNSQS
jgi:hypothetical protein